MDWDDLISRLNIYLKEKKLPSASKIAKESCNPFSILIATIISARTKDEVTTKVSEKLFSIAPTPEKLAQLPLNQIEKIIYPSGFYKVKAKNIKTTANDLVKKFNSKVPDSMDELMSLPGVGRKTANLVRNLAFNLLGICVDIHVHRISNRIGLIHTSKPIETEFELMKILPKKYWIIINELFVKFGQNLCFPVSPKCSACPITDICRKINVKKSR